jgi:hypothetical protein
LHLAVEISNGSVAPEKKPIFFSGATDGAAIPKRREDAIVVTTHNDFNVFIETSFQVYMVMVELLLLVKLQVVSIYNTYRYLIYTTFLRSAMWRCS